MQINNEKIADNQANAQLGAPSGSGPNTEAGKAISSRSSLSHGLYAMSSLLPDEDPAEHQALLNGMLKDYSPFNATETSLVYELFDFEWRLRRASRQEAKILSAENPDYKALNYVSLHVARIKRQFSTTLEELTNMQKTNRKEHLAQLQRAATINYADRMLGRPSTIASHGFDFTVEYLERWCACKERFEYAEMVIENAEDAADAGEDDGLDDDSDDLQDAA